MCAQWLPVHAYQEDLPGRREVSQGAPRYHTTGVVYDDYHRVSTGFRVSDQPVQLLEDSRALAKRLLEDYVAMNRAALVHSALVDYLARLDSTLLISVGEIREKLAEFAAQAAERLKVVENLYSQVGG
jgi:hypothetical protein